MLTFSDVVGHENIIDYFQNAFRMQKFSHAYILNGEDGTGKNLLASIFATTLQCEAHDVNPCGVCKSCLQAMSDNHPDIKYITHEKASISVDDIRSQLNNDVQIKPYSSKYKVYIIDEAEKLTEQAQNALLKTIEEPPEYAVILLLTNNSNLFLETILSRCVVLNLKVIPKESIKKYLMEEVKVPDYQAELSATFANGNLGKAIKLSSSEEFSQMKADVVRLMKYIDEYELSEIMGAIKKIAENKSVINDYLDLILLWYRDVLMFKATMDANLVFYKDEVQDIKKQGSNKSFEALDHIIKALDDTKKRLLANVNFEIAMELLLLAMKES
ncbi:DNA polymerase III subunit delta' [Clostridium sp. Marseille-P299]|uniref:DNA polymerase III subunit delta' n=1 Tax=Clostridium sp. Marseille-P299 TaxID=1805477 RepID=UPI0008312067|nr:DNA polymerase III subunit delta' [Clostridium sp. Marseille-P299]